MIPFLPLVLTALAGFAGYQYGKAKSQNNTTVVKKEAESESEKTNAQKANIYNYYTNDSENGNTLFGSDKKTKRTLFGS